MVQTFGTLGRFAECAGSGDGLSNNRGESLASEEALLGDFPAFQGTPDRPFGLSRPCMATAMTVTPEPLRKSMSKKGGKKDPFACECGVCGHDPYQRELRRVFHPWPSRRRASLLLGPLSVTRLRLVCSTHSTLRQAPAAVQLSIASCFTSGLLHPDLISPHLI